MKFYADPVSRKLLEVCLSVKEMARQAASTENPAVSSREYLGYLSVLNQLQGVHHICKDVAVSRLQSVSAIFTARARIMAEREEKPEADIAFFNKAAAGINDAVDHIAPEKLYYRHDERYPAEAARRNGTLSVGISYGTGKYTYEQYKRDGFKPPKGDDYSPG